MSLAAGAKWYRGQRLSAVWDILRMLQMRVAHEQWQTIGGRGQRWAMASTCATMGEPTEAQVMKSSAAFALDAG
jgi:hypothetical protein